MNTEKTRKMNKEIIIDWWDILAKVLEGTKYKPGNCNIYWTLPSSVDIYIFKKDKRTTYGRRIIFRLRIYDFKQEESYLENHAKYPNSYEYRELDLNDFLVSHRCEEVTNEFGHGTISDEPKYFGVYTKGRTSEDLVSAIKKELPKKR